MYSGFFLIFNLDSHITFFFISIGLKDLCGQWEFWWLTANTKLPWKNYRVVPDHNLEETKISRSWNLCVVSITGSHSPLSVLDSGEQIKWFFFCEKTRHPGLKWQRWNSPAGLFQNGVAVSEKPQTLILLACVRVWPNLRLFFSFSCKIRWTISTFPS